jgi:hypothetical protein
VGTQIVLVSPKIVNPEILGLILQTQIRKFLKFATPQIAIRNFLMIFRIGLPTYILDYEMPCLKTVTKVKSRPLIWMIAFKAYICQEKKYFYGFSEVLRPQKMIGSENNKSANR